MYRKYETTIDGKPLSVDIGRLAEQASGACLVRYGDTVILVTATASDRPREGIDFFPLSCDFEERLYSVGKIPGGFIKREGRPSENAMLTSRLIDRPIRPLFPEDYRHDVGVVATVLSVSQDYSPEISAMIGSSIALSISDIPFAGPTGSTSIGLVDGKLIINPNAEERLHSDLELVVSSTKDKVMMIEAGANEVPEDLMYEAIVLAHEENMKLIAFIEEIIQKEGKEKHTYEKVTVHPEIDRILKETVSMADMEAAIYSETKEGRKDKMDEIEDKMVGKLLENFNSQDESEFMSDLLDAMTNYKQETVRHMIFHDHKRPDGRGLNELRPLHSEVDILPRVHGSALFSRGQTQVLSVTTLGSVGESQRIDGLDFQEDEDGKRYMHHYNFPSFSVGETRPSRGPGRREIGHGALAEKALRPVLPEEGDFPYAIRVVSEVVSSNGSTSQAAVCGSTLSLMAAGVPIKRPVAGISAGLVTDEGSDKFILLSDIQGIEDFFGDMDFKVAGTEIGITAIQLDMKIHGITTEIIKETLVQTKRDRMYILENSMLKAIEAPRDHLSEYAPKIAFVSIDPEKMADIIGSRGKTINRIIDESQVSKIDTGDDGQIFVVAEKQEQLDKAIEMIKLIAEDPEIGRIYNGLVTTTRDFGAFVEIAPDKEGLVHISELANRHVKKTEDVLKVGDRVDVKVLEVDNQGKIRLSRKAALKEDEDEE